jgi:hypothetical protein
MSTPPAVNGLITRFVSVREIVENAESARDCPLDLTIIPNYMGINLVNVLGISWTRRDDGQLSTVTICFLPVVTLPEEELPEEGEATEETAESPIPDLGAEADAEAEAEAEDLAIMLTMFGD